MWTRPGWRLSIRTSGARGGRGLRRAGQMSRQSLQRTGQLNSLVARTQCQNPSTGEAPKPFPPGNPRQMAIRIFKCRRCYNLPATWRYPLAGGPASAKRASAGRACRRFHFRRVGWAKRSVPTNIFRVGTLRFAHPTPLSRVCAPRYSSNSPFCLLLLPAAFAFLKFCSPKERSGQCGRSVPSSKPAIVRI